MILLSRFNFELLQKSKIPFTCIKYLF